MSNTILAEKKHSYPSFKHNYPAIRFLGGNLISYIGDQIYLIAIPLIVLAITGSVLSMGIVAAIQRITNLFHPFAGPIVDNFNRKIIMLVCDSGRAILVGIVGVLFLINRIEIWHLYIAAFLIGILSILYNTAQFTLLPMIVNNEELQLANSIESSSFNIAVLLGPTLGSLIISLYNPGYALIINSISFFVAFFTVLSIKFPEKEYKESINQSFLTRFISELVEGFKYVIKIKIIFYTNIALLISTFGTTFFTTIMIIHLKETIHLNIKLIGYLLSIGGLAAIGGSLITNILLKRYSYKNIFLYSFLIGGLSIVLFGFTDSYLLLIISNAVGTLAASAINPCIRTIRQNYSPTNLLGRVQATSRFMTWLLLPIAAFLAGFLSDKLATSNVIMVGGVISASACLVFLHPKVRQMSV